MRRGDGRAEGRALTPPPPLHQFVLQLVKMIEFSEGGLLEREQNQQQTSPPPKQHEYQAAHWQGFGA